jgi:hypothetical protein
MTLVQAATKSRELLLVVILRIHPA